MDEDALGMILMVVLSSVVLLAAVIVVFWNSVDGDVGKDVGCLEQTAAEVVEQDKVAELVADSAMKAYLFFGFTAAAYAQAGNGKNYLLWKGIVEKEAVGNGRAR